MNMQSPPPLVPARRRAIDAQVARAGEWLRDHQTVIRRTQWAVVAIYVALLVAPAFAPLPTARQRSAGLLPMARA